MNLDTQAQIASLQQQVSALQRQLGPMAQNQLSLPLDPLTIAAIRSVARGGSSGVSVGQVAGGAPGAFFPAGWSVTNGSTGLYAITHTLGTAAFAAFAIPLGTPSVPNVFAQTSTVLTFQFYSLSVHPQNNDFLFAFFA